jgi:ankyrin repeat protein
MNPAKNKFTSISVKRSQEADKIVSDIIHFMTDVKADNVIQVVSENLTRASTIFKLLAREISKQNNQICIKFFRNAWDMLRKPSITLRCSLLFDILASNPDLFLLIKDLWNSNLRLILDSKVMLDHLVSSLLRLNHLEFVILVEDLPGWEEEALNTFKELSTLASSIGSKCKFIISSDQCIPKLEGKFFDLDVRYPERLESTYSVAFQNRPALMNGGKNTLKKLQGMGSTGEVTFVVKFLSRAAIISSHNALLSYVESTDLDLKAIYYSTLKEITLRPQNTILWTFHALSWLAHATRPLAGTEMSHAISHSMSCQAETSEDTEEYLSLDPLGDLDRYLGAFINIEGKKILPLRGIVKSFWEYCSEYDELVGPSRIKNMLPNHASIAAYCVKYLQAHPNTCLELPKSDDRQTEFNKDPFAQYASAFWLFHYAQSPSLEEAPTSRKLLNEAVMSFLGSSAMLPWYESYCRAAPAFFRKEVHPRTSAVVAFHIGLFEVGWETIQKANDSLDASEYDACLDIAVFYHHDDSIQRLISRKVKGNLALNIAATTNQSTILEDMIGPDAPIDQVDTSGFTPLQNAVRCGFVLTATKIINLGGLRSKKAPRNNSILHLACSSGKLEMVQWILGTDSKADLTLMNDDSMAPLDLASSLGYEDIVKELLRTPELKDATKERLSALNFASANCHLPVMDLLIREQDGSKLEYAAGQGHLVTVKCLLSGTDSVPSGLLTIAAGADKPLMVEYLLTLKADPNEHSPKVCEDKTPLAEAAFKGHINPLRCLLAGNADVNMISGDGKTPLQFAVQQGRQSAVLELLLYRKTNVNIRNGQKETALHYALKNTEIVQLLLWHKASHNIADRHGNTPLLKAAKEGLLETVRALLDHGADPAETNDDGNNALHNAAIYRQSTTQHNEIATLIIGTNKELVNVRNNSGKTALHICVEKPSNEVLTSLLLGAGASSSVPDLSGETALHYAVNYAEKSLIELLLKSKSPPDQTNNRKESPLHLACQRGDADIVEMLLTYDVNIDRTDEEKRTPIYLAAYYGKVKVVSILREKGADQFISDEDDWSPLHVAYDSAAVVESLIKEKDAMNQKTNDGRTTLMLAAKWNHLSVVKLLVDSGASLDERDREGLTALHHAILYTECMDSLLKGKINAHLKNNQNATCLELAANLLDSTSCKFLLKNVRDWSTTDVIMALGNSTTSCFDLIIEEDPSIATRVTEDGTTPLHEALQRGHFYTALRLLQVGTNPWKLGGSFISLAHLATHYTANEGSSDAEMLAKLLKEMISSPIDASKSAVFNYLKLALDVRDQDMWLKYRDADSDVWDIRDDHLWSLDDFSRQANNPFGEVTKSKDQDVVQKGPSGMEMPDLWSSVYPGHNRNYSKGPSDEPEESFKILNNSLELECCKFVAISVARDNYK